MTDALFDGIEGGRAFDVAWGIGSCLLCLAVASPILVWMLGRRPVALFGAATDPRRVLQFGYGLFGMFLAFSDLGCRMIPHHHLAWVHAGFLVLTVLYVAALGPRVVALAFRARRRAPAVAGRAIALAACVGLGAAVAPPGEALGAVPSASVTPPLASAGCAGPVLPVHGRLLATRAASVRVRLDAVTAERPASALTVARAALRPGGTSPRPGDPFDALLASCRGTLALLDVHRALPFVAGVPDEAFVTALGPGDALPHVLVVDAAGRASDLAATSGKITLMSFVFTRCPDRDICPAISGKFAYMQHQLDPSRYRLVLVTLDPPYDSPAVLAAYGKTFGADPRRWTLLTGEAGDVKHLVERFGVTSLSDRPGRYVHDDELVMARPDGTIDRVIDTAGWNPDDVVAQALTLGGGTSNPLRRLELASIAGIAALCGGSQSTGIVVLDSAVFVLGVLVLGSILVWWGRRIFAREA